MSGLSLNNVTKRYGSLVAVDAATFEAGEGRILGLLGPNGAGKTSTIRMITDILRPDEGEIRLDGKAVGAWSRERMGYLPEERGLYKKLRVGDQLRYLAALKGMDRAEASRGIRYWLERLDLSAWEARKANELSKGMQQKVQFVATILPRPRLVILDEPFSGLDPINSELLREIIAELRTSGTIVLFASHRMEQVEQICDDICLIAKGRIVLNGSLREIKRSFGRDMLNLEFDGDAAFLEALEKRGRIRITDQGPQRYSVRLLEGTRPREILNLMLRHARDVYCYELVEPSLNEIFVRTVS